MPNPDFSEMKPLREAAQPRLSRCSSPQKPPGWTSQTPAAHPRFHLCTIQNLPPGGGIPPLWPPVGAHPAGDVGPMATSRRDHQPWGHLGRRSPWCPLVALVAPRDLKNLSFSTLCPWARGGEGDGAKLRPKPWILLMGQAFPTKSSWACVHWWSPWSRVGFKPLNGVYPGLRSGPVAEEGPDVGLFPFLFLFLLEIMTELMS